MGRRSVAAAVASAGIWPALPLTGYWVMVQAGKVTGSLPIPTIAAWALMAASGIVVWSPVLLAAAACRSYRPAWCGTAGWGVTLVGSAALLVRGAAPSLAGQFVAPWDWAVLAGLGVAGGLYFGFPTECILGGMDMGMYANHAVYIAHSGRLDVPYPWDGCCDSDFANTLRRHETQEGLFASQVFVGAYKTEPMMTMCFAHLFPLWLAQAYSAFGYRGLVRLNGVFALLSLAAFYGLCVIVLPRSFAVVATLFLAWNVSQVWVARVTLSEMLTQLLIWCGLLFMVIAVKDGHEFLARWSGALLGLTALVRCDCLFLAPLLLFAEWLGMVVEPPGDHSVRLRSVHDQTSLAVLGLAAGYIAVFSGPYFQSLRWYLRRVMEASALAACALLLTGTSVPHWVRALVTGRTIALLTGVTLIGLTGYAYWIRPRRNPPSKMDWPGHPLHGGAYHKERSLANLAAYISPVVVWAGVAGWYVALYETVWQQRGSHLLQVLIVTAGFSTLYLWEYCDVPYHFFSVRRFTPVVIPGFVFFSAYGTWLVWERLPPDLSLVAGIGAVLLLAEFTVCAGASVFAFAENRGLFAQFQALAERLPEGELILAHGSPQLLAPLYFAFGKRIAPVNLDRDSGKSLLENWVTARVKAGEPAYLLCEGGYMFTTPRTRVLHGSLLYWSYIEMSAIPLPRAVWSESHRVVLYRIEGTLTGGAYLDVPLGRQGVWGVSEDGFHPQWSEGQSGRWTNGRARLVVPLNATALPRTLRMNLHTDNPKKTRVEVLVNGRRLTWVRISPGRDRSVTVDIGSQVTGDRLSIELVSDTFVPSQLWPRVADSRILGVLVKEITILGE
jgi:hypothetical protein